MRIRKNDCRTAAWTIVAASALLMQSGIVARAQDKAPADPTEFLKWSMTHYAALSSFQADCDWSDSFSGSPKMTARRTLVIAMPNRYKVVCQQTGSPLAVRMTSVSDGKTAVEYSDKVEMGAMQNPVPASIGTAKSMMMQHPMFCGTPLYLFFSGPAKLAELADTKKQPIAFGPDVTIDGHSYKTVTFYATGNYGKTEAAIGTEDGLVHRIRYGSEPLLAMIADSGLGKQAGNVKITSDSEEDYTNIVVNSTVPDTAFDTTLPKGTKRVDPAAMGQDQPPKPPVPLGKTAPDFTVKTLAGEKRSLTDYRGKVVLIDFWATWCPPCRKGLPETQALAKAYGDRGLAVLAISDEDAKTVSPFIKTNHYSFPAYLDAGSRVSRAYHIAAIPTVVIIDKTGHLVAYMVGLQDPATIEAELKKAGLKLR